jgi:hypothetical protein
MRADRIGWAIFAVALLIAMFFVAASFAPARAHDDNHGGVSDPAIRPNLQPSE